MSSTTSGIGGPRPVTPQNSAFFPVISMEFESNVRGLSSLEILDFDGKTWDHTTLFWSAEEDMSHTNATFCASKSSLYLIKAQVGSDSPEQIVFVPAIGILKLSVTEEDNYVQIVADSPCEMLTYEQALQKLKKSVFN